MESGSIDRQFVPKPRVVFSPLEGGGLLVDLQSGDCWELNRVGAALWSGLVGGESLRATVARIQRDFEVDPTEAESDARRLCASLLSVGLIRNPESATQR